MADRLPPTPATRTKRKRPHRAAASRVLAAGISSSLTIGIVASLQHHDAAVAKAAVPPTSVAVVVERPRTIVRVVVRHHRAKPVPTTAPPAPSATAAGAGQAYAATSGQQGGYASAPAPAPVQGPAAAPAPAYVPPPAPAPTFAPAPPPTTPATTVSSASHP
jgi:hypothetical protein